MHSLKSKALLEDLDNPTAEERLVPLFLFDVTELQLEDAAAAGAVSICAIIECSKQENGSLLDNATLLTLIYIDSLGLCYKFASR